MPTRRELLSSVAALPFVKMISNHGEADGVEVSSGKFLIFANPEAFNFDSMGKDEWPWPDIDATVYSVSPRPGFSVQDEVCIFKLHEDKP